jgi:hypothetical protein
MSLEKGVGSREFEKKASGKQNSIISEVFVDLP